MSAARYHVWTAHWFRKKERIWFREWLDIESTIYNVANIDKVLQVEGIEPPVFVAVILNRLHVGLPDGPVKERRQEAGDEEEDDQLGRKAAPTEDDVVKVLEVLVLAAGKLKHDVRGEKAAKKRRKSR